MAASYEQNQRLKRVGCGTEFRYSGSDMLRYFYFTNSPESPGVLEALEAKISALRKFYPSASAVIFHTGPPRQIVSEVVAFEHLRLLPRQALHLLWPLILWGWIRKEPNQQLLIVRAAFPSPLSKLLFTKREFNFVTEHHSVLNEESRLLSGFGSWASRMFLNFARKLQDETLDGKICVTDEIARHESFGGKILVIGNSAEGPVLATKRLAPFSGGELRVGMPSSRDFPWHGEDRLVASAVQWVLEEPELEVQIDIIGYGGSKETPHPRVTVNRLGNLKGEELVAHMNNMHLGVSSLALFRKGMEEASPLKSRFFVSQRIPFIYGYQDPDIVNDSDVTLRVANRQEIIPWVKVKRFLARLSDKNHDQEWSSLQRAMSAEKKAKLTQEFLDKQGPKPALPRREGRIRRITAAS
jgi:hypothetical protein